jgi:hypothetical protein
LPPPGREIASSQKGKRHRQMAEKCLSNLFSLHSGLISQPRI